MIIWLASYPKSGNTWIRIFLSSLFSKEKTKINDISIPLFPKRYHFDELTDNINDVEEFVKNCIHAQTKINLDNKIKILKTHNAFWRSGKFCYTDNINTSGCIYIVRDPRNVITSLKNHYYLSTYEDAFKFISDEKKLIGNIKNPRLESELPTVISSWKNHYNSWKKLKTNYLLIKYENLIDNPFAEFNKIISFLEKFFNYKFDSTDVDRAISYTNFEKLQKQESLEGFKEANKNTKGEPIKFFNLGPKNTWQKMLDSKTISKIENEFYTEMKEIGYL